jgi:hypothetical protein
MIILTIVGPEPERRHEAVEGAADTWLIRFKSKSKCDAWMQTRTRREYRVLESDGSDGALTLEERCAAADAPSTQASAHKAAKATLRAAE